ncbi:hypothetical protein [Halomonas denitrificans]|nr:hypothetical protein [Halomonas denitrificans]
MTASVATATNIDRPVPANRSSLEDYRTLWAWMLVPMVLMQAGIFLDYWGDFRDNDWSIHVHYWTATLWYLYLILQPYWATHGRMDLHRTNGILGMFLAGGVGITSLSMLGRDLRLVRLATENPERFGPFTPEFFYGVAAVELPMVLIFCLAVVMAILRRKSLEDHAWWLVSTVFVIMMPAVGRGMQALYLIAQADRWPNVDGVTPIILGQVFVVALTLAAAWKYGKLKHPATWWALGINVYAGFAWEIGQVGWVQRLLDTLIHVS